MHKYWDTSVIIFLGSRACEFIYFYFWARNKQKYPCPKGTQLTQKIASELAKEKGLIIIPGYYKGIDERLFEALSIERISLGDFVLSSGEVPAFAIAESIIRLQPGVIGNKESMCKDSIMNGILEAPQYTQPLDFQQITRLSTDY